MRKIALVNQKGGCGKTTTAINLACCLAGEDKKVLLIDLDPQGHSALGLGVKPESIQKTIYEVLSGEVPISEAIQALTENLDAVFSDVVLSAFEQVMAGAREREYKLQESLEDLGDNYDYLIIDNRVGSVPEDPILVKASKTWLKAVYRNLVSNAIKYGGNGCSVALGYENHNSFCRLNVYNSGRPIPDECHGKLFTRFGRLDNNGSRSADGLGLGLFLVKDIIQKHGGDTWYEAKEHGSNFVFTLPLD